MKLVAYSLRLTAASVAVFALALLFNAHAAAAFIVAASAFLLSIVARDYAPRARRWEPSLRTRAGAATARRDHALRLAV